jgi:RHS repeat-associated protein
MSGYSIHLEIAQSVQRLVFRQRANRSCAGLSLRTELLARTLKHLLDKGPAANHRAVREIPHAQPDQFRPAHLTAGIQHPASLAHVHSVPDDIVRLLLVRDLRTVAQEGSRSSTATYNNLNQLTGLAGGGTTWFRGTVNEAANITIGGQDARVYADGTFEALINLGTGVHDVPMQATDKAGNTTSQTWRVDNGPAGTVTPTHDTEGNLLTDGRYTYTWDARNRMTGVTQAVQPSGTATTWAFSYDGANRRTRETKAGVEVRQWVWSGTSIQEERLPNGTKQRFWTGGIEILNGSNQQTAKRLVVTDHLGSTRAVVDGTSGTATASYDYSPWGKRTRSSDSEDWSTGYTGHGWHESGLSLAVYRSYDPETGRWPSRDPIGENGGLNLYGYVSNGPLAAVDPLGLQECLNSWMDKELVATMRGAFADLKKQLEAKGHSVNLVSATSSGLAEAVRSSDATFFFGHGSDFGNPESKPPGEGFEKTRYLGLLDGTAKSSIFDDLAKKSGHSFRASACYHNPFRNSTAAGPGGYRDLMSAMRKLLDSPAKLKISYSYGPQRPNETPINDFYPTPLP